MPGYRQELDLAVVGAGVLGLATTEALVRRGARVTCFDGRPPGQGQSGGLTRTFRHRHDEERVVALAVEARAGYRRWEERVGRQLIGGEGAVYLGMGPEDVRGLALHGVPHHFADAASGPALFGPLTTVDGPLLVDPGAGAIRARRTIETLLGWVGDRVVPADIHTVAVLPSGDGVEIQTADAIYRARHVVLCAGTANPRLAAGVGFDIPLACALHARPHFRVRSRFAGTSLPCWVDRSGAFGEMVYGSPIGGTGRYVIGLIGPGVDLSLGSGGLPAGTCMEDHVRRVRAYVERALPGFEPEPVGIRVCVMSKLPAGSDAFHTWHTDGVTAIAGHNLFKLAPVLGELLADAAIKNQLPEALEQAGERALTSAGAP